MGWVSGVLRWLWLGRAGAGAAAPPADTPRVLTGTWEVPARTGSWEPPAARAGSWEVPSHTGTWEA